MGIQIIIIFFIILMLALGGASLYVVVNPKFKVSADEKENNSKKQNKDNSHKTNLETGDTKEFFPVKEFYDNALSLGNHEYRAIIEVGSVNYGLLSPQEQQIVDLSYKQFLNSLSFPIELYTQTIEFDQIAMQDELHKNILESVKAFPSINQYASLYEEHMSHLTEYLQNSKIKKNYVIIPFRSEDLSDMSALSNAEIKDFAIDELYTRTSLCAESLAGCGMSTRVLTKTEIAEVLYSYYHRNAYRIADDILHGTFSSISIQSQTHHKQGYDVDVILAKAENEIKSLLTPNSSYEEQNLYKYIIEILGDLRVHTSPDNLMELLELSRNMAQEERYRTYGVYEIGEPTNEDYIKAFQVSGSGVPKQLVDEIIGSTNDQSTVQFDFDSFFLDNTENLSDETLNLNDREEE